MDTPVQEKVGCNFLKKCKILQQCTIHHLYLIVLERTPKYWILNTPNIECPNIELSEHHILAQNWTSNISNITKNWTVHKHRTVHSKTSKKGQKGLSSQFKVMPCLWLVSGIKELDAKADTFYKNSESCEKTFESHAWLTNDSRLAKHMYLVLGI